MTEFFCADSSIGQEWLPQGCWHRRFEKKSQIHDRSGGGEIESLHFTGLETDQENCRV